MAKNNYPEAFKGNMEPDNNKLFWREVIWPVLKIFIIAGITLAILFLSAGCKILQTKQSSSSDTSSVKKELQVNSKVDTSKTKSESQYTRETFIVPGRDTTINNFIFQPGNQQPTVYIRETGSKKEETNTFQFADFRKEILDSLSASKQESKVETKVKVLDFWQILALGLIGLIIVFFIGSKFLVLKK